MWKNYHLSILGVAVAPSIDCLELLKSEFSSFSAAELSIDGATIALETDGLVFSQIRKEIN